MCFKKRKLTSSLLRRLFPVRYIAVILFAFGLVATTDADAADMVNRELWRGVFVNVPKAAEVKRYRKFDQYEIRVYEERRDEASGSYSKVERYTVSLERWRMPREMHGYSDKQVVRAFRGGQQPGERLTISVKNGGISKKLRNRGGWAYVRMVRLSRGMYAEAMTSFNKWRSKDAAEARRVVDSLKFR